MAHPPIAPKPAILYREYTTRLQHLSGAIAYAHDAVLVKQKTTKAPDFTAVVERNAERMHASLAETGKDVERVMISKMLGKAVEPLKTGLIFTRETAPSLLLNLGLVMLCTQLELFINHLLDVILAEDPRRLKTFASEKSLSASEAADLPDYPAVLQRLRDKVIDEVDRSATRKKFTHHLGKRFHLIEPSEIKITPPVGAPPDGFEGWNFEKLIETFDQRHSIVHKGALPLDDPDYLAKVGLFFSMVQTVLTVNAIHHYKSKLQPPDSVEDVLMTGKLCGISDSSLDEVIQAYRKELQAKDLGPAASS